MQSLSLSRQEFSSLRELDMIYVDKTMFIHQLYEEKGGYFFLSRPRRFGKSLLLNTIKELFLGNKHFFENTFIYDKIEWKKFPVIKIDFSSIGVKSIGLENALIALLYSIAAENKVVLNANGLDNLFKELIVNIHQKTGEKAVILIDEYDKPIIDYIDNIPQATFNRDILKSFFSVLKSADEHLRFFLMTGVSRFSKVSIFSDLNNLTDITFNEKYNEICGYTITEIEKYFPEYIKIAAKHNKLKIKDFKAQMKEYYNGYSWSTDAKNTVYNPWSLMSLLHENSFKNYWFETGTPTFLVKLLKKDFKYDFEEVSVDTSSFSNYQIENIDTISLMLQTGYLTLKKSEKRGRVVLSYPNWEVRNAMLKFLISDYTTEAASTAPNLATNIIDALEVNDLERFILCINALFAKIPYEYFKGQSEAYYHSIVFLALHIVGCYVQAEVHHASGRLDAVLHIENRVYVIEFKLDKSANEAMNQIRQNNYYAPYLGQQQAVYLIGINFSSKDKKVEEWKVEEV